MNSARTAYETLEPFHVLAYFNPGMKAALDETGLSPIALYAGGRGAPLGPCAPSVVTATFYNFNPGLIEPAWRDAVAVGLDTVSDARYRMLDEQLRAIIGDGADEPVIGELADTFEAAVTRLPLGGRPLAAAWASGPVPEAPHLRLWRHVAVLREWRGDNHIAALVTHGLDGLDVVTFHEADLPDPTVKRRIMGREMIKFTRGWSDDDWERSVDRLVAAGLAERTDTPNALGVAHRLTADGAATYDDIEAETDALGETIWSAPELIDALDRIRPYVKAILDAGVLPGTRKK